MRWSGFAAFHWFMVIGLTAFIAPVTAEVAERTRLAIETLNRLRPSNPASNPTLQEAASRVADQLRGEPELVEIVDGFELKGRKEDLIAFATAHPAVPQAADAVRLALNDGAISLIGSKLTNDIPSPMGLLQAMTSSGDPRCLPLVLPLITQTNRSLEIRSEVLKVFASTAEGSSNLLTLLQTSVIPVDLVVAAGALLRDSRWAAIRAGVPPAAPGVAPRAPLVLPPMPELIALGGDPDQGKSVFRRPSVGCSGCHQVRGEGVDFGPKLTEIGAKLGKDALITSVVDPSAGISFGFEAWRITLKDGDELLGLIASETNEELLLKQQGGQVMSIPMRDVSGRGKLATSIMPSGLHETLSLSEFGDLISYLMSLRPAPR